MASQQLDPVSVLVALLSLILGPALAQVVSPHAAILIAASTGASWSLIRREPSTRISAAWFFARINFTALLLTVPVAEIARSFGTPVDTRWLLAPIALVIGAIGDDWPAVFQWLVGRVGKFIDFWIEMRTRSNVDSIYPPEKRNLTRSGFHTGGKPFDDGDDQ